MAALFYHLTRAPLAQTLGLLLGKSRANGWRVVVRGVDADGIAALDAALWLGPDDGFLPHGIAGGPHDAEQPILLTTGDADPANGAQCLMTVHGAGVSAADVEAFERVCILFDGNDTSAVDVARGQWSALKQAGASAQYWSEASGAWEKKAET